MQTMPDYYRILQVHPKAEQEVIEAAYRRLMRKYHPDVLEPSQRPQAQRKVQEINAAYAVLGDPQKRAQYDAAFRNSAAQSLRLLTGDAPAQRQPVQVEKRIYPGRCSKTKQSFQIIMAREKDSTGPFRVVGLTPLEEAERLKPVPGEQGNLFKRLFARIKRRRSTHGRELKAEPPSDQELETMFDQSLVLDFGDIDWAGFQCPFCEGTSMNANGTLATWTLCGKCSRLSCAGGSKRTPAGTKIFVCPWCNSKRQITHSVRAGTKAHKSVRGILSRGQTQGQSQKSTLLETRKSKRLLSSKEKD